MFNLLASDENDLARDGRDRTRRQIWVIDWYSYIVQPDGRLPTARMKLDLHDKAVAGIYRIVATAGPQQNQLRLSRWKTPPDNQPAGQRQSLRRHAQRLLVGAQPGRFARPLCVGGRPAVDAGNSGAIMPSDHVGLGPPTGEMPDECRRVSPFEASRLGYVNAVQFSASEQSTQTIWKPGRAAA